MELVPRRWCANSWITGDVMLYVVGGADENEIMLYNVVLALRDSLNILLKYAYPTVTASLSLSY